MKVESSRLVWGAAHGISSYMGANQTMSGKAGIPLAMAAAVVAVAIVVASWPAHRRSADPRRRDAANGAPAAGRPAATSAAHVDRANETGEPAPATIAAVTPEVGDSTLTGHVYIHGTEEPAAGVAIEAFRDQQAMPIPEDPMRIAQLALPYRATSGEDGSFRISGMPSGSYFVFGEGSGFVRKGGEWRTSLAPGSTASMRLEVERTLRVRGRVVDARGRPLAGVVVQTSLNGTATERTYRTGQDGAFDADDVVVGSSLSASHPEFVTTEVRWTELWAKQLTNIEVVLRPASSLSGVVVAADGSPVAGQEVVAKFSSRSKRTVKTEADGTFRIGELPPGDVTVETKGRHLTRAGAAPFVATLREGEDVTGVVIRLAAAASAAALSISGHVVDGEGRAFSQAMVWLRAGPGGASTACRVGSRGEFACDDLDPGSYLISVHGGGAWEEPARPVEAGTADLLLTVRPAARVAGRIVDDATGQPLTKFTLGRERIEAGDGQFDRPALDGATATLTVRADGFAPFMLGPFSASAPGAVVDVGTVRMERAARIRGRLVDRSGQPVAGVGVEARPVPDDFMLHVPRTSSGPDGSFELGRLRPGRWCVAPSSSTWEGCASGRIVDVQAGERVERLQISTLR